MKKIIFLMLAAFSLASCVNHDSDLYDEYAKNEAKQAEYNLKFVEEFGAPAADQDWGFGTTETRSVYKGDMVWANNKQVKDCFELPSEVTEEELNEVLAFYSNNVLDQNESEVVDFTNFFIQSVYVGTRTTTVKNGDKVVGSSKMNQYYVNGEKLNDFNAAVGDYILITNSKSTDFGYESSLNSSTKYSTYFIKKIGDYYYVGFDFEAHGVNPNEQADADGYFDDRIFRLVPAVEKVATRVFAEDLGSIGDWDFNDVVFDVTVSGKVILQAAGGTLPLYLKINDTKYEVHAAFGVDTNVIVNTINGGTTKEPKEIVTNFTGTAADIQITVVDGSEREIRAITGQPAAKFAVNKAIPWSEEYQNIQVMYPKFKKYVSNTSYAETWYLNDIE